MPGNLPMDFGALVSEMKKYLEEGWDPVIKSDVDGENALPLRIDKEHKYFGRISATRRAARTVYMGSAARPDGSRGIDVKRVVLGCAQPGEPVNQFADALKRLSGLATHLYVDGAQYWYSLQPNVTRVAADRAASNYEDRDADDEVKKRIAKQQDRGDFAAIQVFAEGPGDVPDDEDGVRLVVLTPGVTHSINDQHSPAIELAGRILNQRDAGPHLNRNLVVFIAAAATRLGELRAATRLYLAWQSIVDDSAALDLTEHQKRQAQSKTAEISQQVDSLIGETFTLVLTPSQVPGTGQITWQTTKTTVQGDLGARASRKLGTEEKLIAAYGGVRVKMDLDRYDLWSDRHDMAVNDLWSTYARYPHMPRLVSYQVLADAISNGTSNLNWSQETFGYADAHDGTTWVGVHTGQNVTPAIAGLLIHPDHVPPPQQPEPRPKGFTSSGDGYGTEATTHRQNPPTLPARTQFYAQFDLNPLRGISELGEIRDHVLARLGPDVELSLEIRATNPEGYDDTTQRIISENASNLGTNASEFE